MTRTRIAGAVLLVVLGVGLLIWIADDGGVSKNPARAAVKIRAEEKLLATETVDLANGNLHLEIPILVTHKKPTAPRSGKWDWTGPTRISQA